MKKFLPIMLGFTLIAGNVNVFANEIPQLKNVNDNNLKIQELKDKGIINGYNNGDLGLKNGLKRSEVAKLLAELIASETELNKYKDSSSGFSDVARDYWANEYISYMKKNMNNIINGYPDGTFKPESKITKAELLKILVIFSNKDLTYKEIKEANWPEDWLNWAKKQGIIDDKFDVSFENINSEATREFAFIAYYNAISDINKIKKEDVKLRKSNENNTITKIAENSSNKKHRRKTGRNKEKINNLKKDDNIVEQNDNNQNKKDSIAEKYHGEASLTLIQNENINKSNIIFSEELPEETKINVSTLIDTSQVGTNIGKLTLLFKDGSEKEINLTVKVIKKVTEADKNTPIGKTVNIIATEAINSLSDFIENYNSLNNVKDIILKDGTKNIENLTDEYGEKILNLKVIYNDNSSDEVTCKINVIPIYEVDFVYGDEEEHFEDFIANDIQQLSELRKYTENLNEHGEKIDFQSMVNILKENNKNKDFIGWILNDEKKVYTTEELKELSFNTIKDKFKDVTDEEINNTKKLIIKPKFENRKVDTSVSLHRESGRYQYSFTGTANPESHIRIVEKTNNGREGYSVSGDVLGNGTFNISIDPSEYKQWLADNRAKNKENYKSFIITETKDDKQLNKKEISIKLDSKVIVTRVKGEENFNQGLNVYAKNNTESDAISSATVNYWPGDNITVHADNILNDKVFRRWEFEGEKKFTNDELEKNNLTFNTDESVESGYGFKAIYEEPKKGTTAPEMKIVENVKKSSKGTIKFNDDVNESSLAWIKSLMGGTNIIIKKDNVILTENKQSEFLLKDNEYYIRASYNKIIFKNLKKGNKISIQIPGYNEGIYYYDGNKLVDSMEEITVDTKTHEKTDKNNDNIYKYILKSAVLKRNKDNSGSLTLVSEDGKTLGSSDSSIAVYELVDNHTDYNYYINRGSKFKIKDLDLSGKKTDTIKIRENYMDRITKDIIVFVKENSNSNNNDFSSKGLIIRLNDIKEDKDELVREFPIKEDWKKYSSNNIKGNSVYEIELSNLSANKTWIDEFLKNKNTIKVEIRKGDSTETLSYESDINKLMRSTYSLNYSEEYGGSFKIYFSNYYNFDVKKITIKNGNKSYSLILKNGIVESVE